MGRAFSLRTAFAKPSSRYAVIGLAALAVLSAVHWQRDQSGDSSPAVAYLLGVLPNVAAAVAIPFVLLGIWADQNADAPYAAAGRWFCWLLLSAGVALVAWEFTQLTSRGLVFDPHDLGATVVGLVLAAILFRATRPPETTPSSDS